MDLRDVTVDRLHGIEAVIHLAAVSDDPLGAVAGDVDDAVNHRAAARLARLARDAGMRRFLFASTCEVYGSRADGSTDEDAGQRTDGRRLRSEFSRVPRLRQLRDAGVLDDRMRRHAA